MSIQGAASKAAKGARALADDVLDGAEDAVNATRDTADKALDKAQDGVDALREQAHPVIDDLAARAQDLASRSIDYCAETTARARRKVAYATECTSEYVAEQPIKSLLIAAASGAVLSALLIGISKRRDRC